MTPEELMKNIFSEGELPYLRPLLQIAEIRFVRKGQLLFHEGELPEELLVMFDGVYRGFFESTDGKDITDCFCCRPGDPLVGSIPLGSRSMISFEAIQSGHILALPLEPVLELIEKDQTVARVYNRMLLDSLHAHVEIKKVLYQFDAMQKYKWFLQKYPGLDRKATVRCIASYLDISPVTLSRVRSELAGEQADPPFGDGVSESGG